MDLETAHWHKSSHSGSDDVACVEVAITPGTVGIRDTKNRTGGTLIVPGHTWRALTRSLTT